MFSYKYITYKKVSKQQQKLIRKYSGQPEIYGNPLSIKIPGENNSEIVCCTNDVSEHDDKHYPYPHNFLWIIKNNSKSVLHSEGVKVANSERVGSVCYLNIHKRHSLISKKRPNFESPNDFGCNGRYGLWIAIAFSYKEYSLKNFQEDFDNFSFQGLK